MIIRKVTYIKKHINFVEKSFKKVLKKFAYFIDIHYFYVVLPLK